MECVFLLQISLLLFSKEHCDVSKARVLFQIHELYANAINTNGFAERLYNICIEGRLKKLTSGIFIFKISLKMQVNIVVFAFCH